MNLLQIYKKSLFIRTFEENLDLLFRKGLINGTAHFCIGQEYIPVIVSQYLDKEDIVTSTHRGHGHALAKDLNPREFLAELMGKQTGYNSGKGGSQHVMSRKDNFYANGISGGLIPVACGMAFANKYQGKKNVVVTYLGDGGFNEGYVQESFNIAALWDLPILFICENNQYAMSTHIKKAHATEICQRIKSLNITCESTEFNDYKKLDTVADTFIKQIRITPKPYFVEVKTYRHHGHSKNDKNLYRDKEEEEEWFKTDVLVKLEEEIISQKKYSKEEIRLLKEKIQKEIEEISQEVLQDPINNIDNIYDFVYKE